MRRTIKFRAWNGKTFISTGIYIKQDGSTYSYEKDYGGTFSSDERLEPKQCVIQMFTGFLDKNGTEIYEGDFIRFGKLEGVYSDQMYPIVEATHSYVKDNSHKGKVIGNIFENPELLK